MLAFFWLADILCLLFNRLDFFFASHVRNFVFFIVAVRLKIFILWDWEGRQQYISYKQLIC